MEPKRLKKTPDQLSVADTLEEEDFFVSETDTSSQQGLTEQKEVRQRPQPYIPKPPHAKKYSVRAAAVLAAGLTIGGAFSRSEQFENAQGSEEETVHEEKAQGIHRLGVTVLEQLADPTRREMLEQRTPAEVVEFIAETIAEFPYSDMHALLVERVGAEYQEAVEESVKGMSMYSAAMSQEFARNRTVSPETLQWMNEVQGFASEQNVYLNVDMLYAHARRQSERQGVSFEHILQEVVQEAVLHEAIHTVHHRLENDPHEEVNAFVLEYQPHESNAELLNEGLTQAMTLRVYAELFGEAPQSGGYDNGPVQAGELLLQFNADAAEQALFFQDIAPLAEAFDTTYGEGRFEQAITFGHPQLEDGHAAFVFVLHGLVYAMGKDAPQAIDGVNAVMDTLPEQTRVVIHMNNGVVEDTLIRAAHYQQGVLAGIGTEKVDGERFWYAVVSDTMTHSTIREVAGTNPPFVVMTSPRMNGEMVDDQELIRQVEDIAKTYLVRS